MTAMNYQNIRSGQILKEEPENRDLKAASLVPRSRVAPRRI